MHLTDISIVELQKGFAQKDFSIREVVAAYKKNIEATEERIKSFITLDWEAVDARITELENMQDKQDQMPLYGVPISVKDVLMTKGIRTTAGSRMLEEYTATFTATSVQKLLDAGVIIVGKTNCDEFAQGTSTENSGFFPTKNPYDVTKVPGGSSGGAASSVAAEQVAVGIGTDTGGSIRLPAAFCGTVAFKPTYGAVSRYGLIAMASSFDTIGPITHTVSDAAIALQAMMGVDSLDSTTYKSQTGDLLAAAGQDVRGMKVGIPQQADLETLPEVLQAEIAKTRAVLEQAGVILIDIDMPSLKSALAVYYVIVPAEVSSNMAKFDGIRFGTPSKEADNLLEYYLKTRGSLLGDEVRRRIMVGTYVLSSGYIDAYYVQAQKVRRLVKQDYERVFKDVDAVLLPTTPSTAFGLGEKTDDPLQMYLVDIYTISVNIAGVPALAVPTGLVDGMPYGVQFIGPQFGEERLVALGSAFEKARGEIQKPDIIS